MANNQIGLKLSYASHQGRVGDQNFEPSPSIFAPISSYLHMENFDDHSSSMLRKPDIFFRVTVEEIFPGFSKNGFRQTFRRHLPLAYLYARR